MKLDEYKKMDAVEDRMWWYRALHANLLALFGRVSVQQKGGRMLDAGCGTGGFLQRFRREFPGWQLFGLDFKSIAASLARKKSAAAVCGGSLNALPFKDEFFNAIFSNDVLCHRSVNQDHALAEFYRCLSPAGTLILNLPAYQWLMSYHDQAVHTARRYTAAGIKRSLHAAGFQKITTTYWNCLPFPLMVLRRKILSGEQTGSDVMPYPEPIELLFRNLMRCETALLRNGGALPFGGSVLVIAHK